MDNPLNDIRAEIDACAEGIKDRLERVEKAIEGKDGILTISGKWGGRRGKLRGVIPDHQSGVLILVMLYKSGTKEFLNAASDTRCYRPLSHFMIVDPT